MSNSKRIFPFLILLFMGVSCGGDNPSGTRKTKQLTGKELMKINKRKVAIESQQIDRFAKRRGWDMTKTGTGLRYLIYEQGDTSKARPVTGQKVAIYYKVYLINGKEIYSNMEGKPAQFEVGHDMAESGLHEGVTYMHPGAKAHFILPSNLAHGFTGDFSRIPSDATVIFDIELLDVH